MTSTESAVALGTDASAEVKQLYIDGRWVPAMSGRTFPTLNPSTGEVLAHLSEGTGADIDLAVQAARRAMDGPWGRTNGTTRQRALLRLADVVESNYDQLRMLDVTEMGVPVSRTQNSGGSLADSLRYFAGWATKLHGETIPNSARGSFLSYTLKEPVGVVGSIIPWNGPLPASLKKLAYALTVGCTIVLKPAEQAALSPLKLAELIQDLDLPPGVVNVVTGFGETAGAALAQHTDVDKVAFTGSTDTGRQVVAAATSNMKRVSLELGGKSPGLVLSDADMATAIPGAAMAAFANSGQVCCAGTRLYVQRSVYDDFVSGVREFAQSITVGSSLDPETEMGPIVSAEQLDRVTGYIDIGRKEGARTVCGGERLTSGELACGYFVEPTVFTDVTDRMRIAREEIFGPVLSIMPFDDLNEVVVRANAGEFGLGAYVWTRDVGRAHRFAQQLRAGSVWVNTPNQVDSAVPFGGYKASGWGREGGLQGLEEYLNVKAVWINLA